MTQKQYRLVTRSDFDGLVCAVLLNELGLIKEVQFAHPKDMQDGKVEITGDDITTNLPYVAKAHLVFDHHLSETLRNATDADNYVIDPRAPSAARVVYNHYGGKQTFPGISEEMMAAVDKADSAQFSIEEILNPKGWVLLNYLMDARTGLGRFREFRVGNFQLMMDLIGYCRNHTIDQILSLPDVQERVALYREHETEAKAQILRCARVHGNVVVLNLQNEEIIHPTNRFMVYALFPDCNVSIHVMWGLNKQNTVFAVGKSIVNRSSHSNIGALMLQYGGGGHEAAGTCQVPHDRADDVLDELVARIRGLG
ncbi:exopolyphosphatase [Chromobacterium amazonense]|uniref:Exopolyphosphatase n=1 Tax=Chromobacterium amazonense TaxID=1382803 RepID=A0A2S9X3X0_9NEIS|nr:exopolyphosphatase [Chromobacterium amazonense]KIA81578.1 exopolyphosphatase [Chromobacterium piscinae]MBM2884258.1 exopolyphosphatase [Chromobacterium amazonense]MDE1711446.1 exopolyphosphatase [Chromobacterium amazonense]MDQ4541943.1 exopolyphosphatase [Chromobacterium amazonense]PRP70421.1 exopolyphosphatase [Chromobacterium amazonense]